MSTPEPLPRMIGSYRLESILGEGGMGRVYLAVHTGLGRRVAIKTLHHHLGGDLPERFTDEARAVARLQHPSIVSVYDFGQAGSQTYIVYEYVNGYSLDSLISKGILSLKESIHIALDMSRALDYVHQRGFLHRDIKPSNILIERGTGRAKLTDFGIAKHLSDPRRTQTGFLGTPTYMAPETVKTPRLYDHRSDIYSLGATFYELFTGELPYGSADDHQSDFDIMYRKVSGEKPASPAALRQDLPTELSNLIDNMLEGDLERRTPTAAKVVSVLEGLVEIPETLESKLKPGSTRVPSITKRIDILAGAPTSTFFAPAGLTQTAFFQDTTIRFAKIEESLIFYRDHLNAEYINLLRQARLTYYLWLTCVSLGFILLLGSIVAMLMGYIKEGLASSVTTLVTFFIQKIFQQREDHYRALAKVKNEHLEYGNQWLLVIQSIDGIADERKRALQQAKLVEVLLRKLKRRKAQGEESPLDQD